MLLLLRCGAEETGAQAHVLQRQLDKDCARAEQKPFWKGGGEQKPSGRSGARRSSSRRHRRG